MADDHSSSHSDDPRVRKLSYERSRREAISEKFRELCDLLLIGGFAKSQISSQADALTATIQFVREALESGFKMKTNPRFSKRVRTQS